MAVASFAPGSVQYWTVPDGITVLRYRVAGGAGASIPAEELGAPAVQAGGKGAIVEGYLAVTPGEQLWIAPGPSGTRAGVENGAGFGRGGARGGGAASALGRGTAGLAAALVVAGGGGGGGEDGTGGNGGGVGGRGTGNSGVGLGGGQDATYTSDVGEPGLGDGTGGGGGGVIGGRAGTIASDRRGGGGGGSSRVPTGATVASTSDGAGTVALTYGLPPLQPTNLTPSGTFLATGRDAELAYQFNGAAGSADLQTSAVITYTTPAGSGSIPLTGQTTKGKIPAALTGTAGTVTWSVVAKGQGGAESPSASTTFTLGAAPATPNLVNPGPATGPTQTVTWTSTGQAAYRLRVTNSDASTVYSGDVVVADPAARTAVVTYPSDGLYVLRLSVRGANGVWSEEDLETVQVTWTPPAAPTVVLTPDPARAAFVVAVTHPTVAGRPAVTSTSYTAVTVSDGPDYGRREVIRVEVDPDGVRRWRGPASDVEYSLVVTDRDALGVPAVGTSPAPARGYGRSAYGAGPYGS